MPIQFSLFVCNHSSFTPKIRKRRIFCFVIMKMALYSLFFLCCFFSCEHDTYLMRIFMRIEWNINSFFFFSFSLFSFLFTHKQSSTAAAALYVNLNFLYFYAKNLLNFHKEISVPLRILLNNYCLSLILNFFSTFVF